MPGDDLSDKLQSYCRYLSSVGFAAGSNVEEAQLHSLYEGIEHDAVSEWVINCFVLRTSNIAALPAASVCPDTLISSVKVRTEGELTLSILPSVVDSCSVTLALGSVVNNRPRDYGAGASVSLEYAAERALSELQQGIVARSLDPNADRRDSAILSRLSNWPWLQRLPLLAVEELQHEPYSSSRFPTPIAEVPEALTALKQTLEPFGGVYSVTLTPDNFPIAVTLTVCPGLDRFDAVTRGWPILPTGRLYTNLRSMMKKA